MFVDKQFSFCVFSWTLLLIEGEKNVIWCSLENFTVGNAFSIRFAGTSSDEEAEHDFFFWARNSISRLNEFPARRELLHSLCVLHFWINHDCNGILCCWDLSHALKQSRNARRWRIFRCERQKHPTGHSQKCLLLSVLCRTGVHLKVNLFKETRKKRERKTFQLSLEQHKKIISTATASFLLPLASPG